MKELSEQSFQMLLRQKGDGKSPPGPRVCTWELPRLACSPSHRLRYRKITPNALLLPNSRSDDSHPKDGLQINDTVLTLVSSELKAL